MNKRVSLDLFVLEGMFTATWGLLAYTNLDTITGIFQSLSYVSYCISTAFLSLFILLMLVMKEQIISSIVLHDTPKLYMVSKFIVVMGLYCGLTVIPLYFTSHFGVGEAGVKLLNALLTVKILFIILIIIFLIIPRLLSKNTAKE